MPLKIGDFAPDFELESTGRPSFKLSRDMKGKACVIYFYPKDFTHLCTKQACDFKNTFQKFFTLDIPIIGVSKDCLETHMEFKKTYSLPFELLCDTELEVARKYDSCVPLINFIRRTTYVLDSNHKILAVYENNFSAKKHIKKVVEHIEKYKVSRRKVA